MAVPMIVRAIPFVCIFTVLSSTDPQEYLKRYGYLEVDPAAASNAEEVLNNGILQFQDFHGLPLTGVLDEETLLKMDAPRCGMPDIEHSASGRLKRYAIASRWRKKDLQFTISKYSENKALSSDSIDSVFASAAKLWEDASDLSITRIKKEKNADMIVSFLTGSHQTNRSSHTDKKLSFDGPGGVLAHASFPPVGEIHFDDDENWLLNGAQKDSYDLMWGAVHEIGHALGLKHTKAQNSVMNPVYKRGIFNQLGQDDIDGIVKLYGEPIKKQVLTEQSTREPGDYTASTDFAFMSSTEESCEVPERTDAVLTIGKAFFMFRGDQVWMFNDETSSPHYPVKISTAFPGIYGPITAAMAGINNKVYFFRNKIVWRWDWISKSVDRGYPKTVRGFGPIYDSIVAAFKWSHNNKAYLFGSRGKYWRYDLYSNRMDPGYPRSIRTWRGIPYHLDDITSAPDGNTYVFKDKSYWIYSNRLYRLHGQRYEIEDKWLSCGARNANLEVEALETLDVEEEVAALTDSTIINHISSTLILTVLSLLAV